MKNILLCVTGSIAVYKAAELANRFVKDGYNVDVIMTDSAVEFVTPLTFQTLTKNRVYTSMFAEYEPDQVEHISLGKKADICLVAPATANIIGKLAGGIADDMATTVIMALEHAPVFICPAMNTRMYENPIVQRNIREIPLYRAEREPPGVRRSGKGRPGGCRGHHRNGGKVFGPLK